MLLIHQAGSVKVGEIVRYTVTYTPSSDRILPSPSDLYIRIKNTSAVPLRAAYLHGPYTLHVSSYPATFNPYKKFETPKRDGIPEFEPNLKAGGHWYSKLHIPDDIRESGEKVNSKRNLDGSPKTCTWIIEVASQILFSNTAAVGYELLIGRDERSLDLGFAAVAGKGHGEPGNIKDFQRKDGTYSTKGSHPKGVYSNAIQLLVEDTAALWNKPPLPQWDDDTASGSPADQEGLGPTKSGSDGPKRKRKPKKIHLVVLTHGLHSNVGADMLFFKESIDASARQAREAARERKRAAREQRSKRGTDVDSSNKEAADHGATDQGANAHVPVAGGQDQIADDEEDEDDEDDDEQVIVRGFTGNACRTDRGVQYLGKRLAKFVLTTTYPDQPFLPTSKSRTLAGAFGANSSSSNSKYGEAVHQGSSIHRKDSKEKLPYTFTSISFIGHSLGGLVQIYAAAYIHKHSPGFFDQIKPRNFVAMATPLLGLSNENPLYVKFALDFGLVGRTGRDLGLTWRAPNLARTGWSAMLAGFGGGQQKQQDQQSDPRAKPLLRILPTGPAHHVLKMFENRTLYANVVNDGIVPLRTSSLLFLDWRGLDKVDNARRENGLIGTMAAFGWAELTGANTMSHRPRTASATAEDEYTQQNIEAPEHDIEVPQPSPEETQSAEPTTPSSPSNNQFLAGHAPEERARSSDGRLQSSEDVPRSYTLPSNPLTDFINLFRPGPGPAHPSHPQKFSKKVVKTYHRAQTIKKGEAEDDDPTADSEPEPSETKRPIVSRGDSLDHDPTSTPPPKTSIFDAASDILNPPLPPPSWVLDPTKRARTIFHDRIYHPEDIPPPPVKRPRMGRSFSSSSMRSNASTADGTESTNDTAVMRVEEKIARAYHGDMSWRKVLVRLEPDAHNNMIVRRMFANAYGWDVVKHVCDTHFADTYAANTKDDEEAGIDRAHPLNKVASQTGEQVEGQTSTEPIGPPRDRTFSESQEASDKVADLDTPVKAVNNMSSGSISSRTPTRSNRKDSVESNWTESLFDDDGDDGDETEDEHSGPFEAFQRFWQGSPKPAKASQDWPGQRTGPEIVASLTMEPSELETHRGIGVVSQTTGQSTPIRSGSARDPDSIEPLLSGGARPPTLTDSFETIGSPGGTTEVGLKRPLDAHVDLSPTNSHVDHGVAEQVARLSAGSRSD